MTISYPNAKAIILIDRKPLAIFSTLCFTALALILPIILPHTPPYQLIMGTLINASLVLILIETGLLNAVFFGFIPPIIAVLSGQAPSFAHISMFLFAIGNVILITSIYFLSKAKPISSLIIFQAGLVKIFFLLISGYLLFDILSVINIQAYNMLGLPIIINTLLGVTLAISFLKIRKYA